LPVDTYSLNSSSAMNRSIPTSEYSQIRAPARS